MWRLKAARARESNNEESGRVEVSTLYLILRACTWAELNCREKIKFLSRKRNCPGESIESNYFIKIAGGSRSTFTRFSLTHSHIAIVLLFLKSEQSQRGEIIHKKNSIRECSKLLAENGKKLVRFVDYNLTTTDDSRLDSAVCRQAAAAVDGGKCEAASKQEKRATGIKWGGKPKHTLNALAVFVVDVASLLNPLDNPANCISNNMLQYFFFRFGE